MIIEGVDGVYKGAGARRVAVSLLKSGNGRPEVEYNSRISCEIISSLYCEDKNKLLSTSIKT